MTRNINYSVSFSWCVKDVLSEHPHLTIEQACNVLDFIACEHDASLGCNWDVIAAAVQSCSYTLEQGSN